MSAKLSARKSNRNGSTYSLYITIVICSIGAAVQDWDQTGSNGANLSFPDEFGIDVGSLDPSTLSHDRDNWLVGIAVQRHILGLRLLVAGFLTTSTISSAVVPLPSSQLFVS
jgi:hypothetical protein